LPRQKAMAELSFDKSKAYLQLDSPNGVIYDHFTKIIAKVIESRPDDPHAAFEILSRYIKTSSSESQPPPVPEEKFAARAAYGEKASGLLKDPSAGDGEGGGPVNCAVPNFMEEAEMFEWASVGFGASESYQIMMSLRKLASTEDPPPKKLRLWGKILGSEKDYLVAEGQMEGGGEGGEDPEIEPNGSGANTYTYWVTSDPCEGWAKLGDVRPDHVRQARLIKRCFTGNLDAKVVSHPSFPGDEKALLRAQIARITADTVLCVSGFLAPPEEDPEGPIEENPNFVFPVPETLAKREGWTHCVDHILRNGRTGYLDVGGEGGEGDEAAEAALKELNRQKEADPPRSKIRGIGDDKDLDWSIRQFGDLATYDTSAGTKSNHITAVRSLTWPGACCVAKSGGGFANIYVGYGVKAGDPDFFPVSPPDIMDEPADPGDQPEPQGQEPAAPVEEEGSG